MKRWMAVSGLVAGACAVALVATAFAQQGKDKPSVKNMPPAVVKTVP